MGNKFNLQTSTYSNLNLALPCTGVTCARSCSSLKIYKCVSPVGQNSLLLTNVERKLTFDVDEIINSIGQSSADLKRYLIE